MNTTINFTFCFWSTRRNATGSILNFSFLVSLFLVSLSTPPAAAQVKHWNFGIRDRISECVGRTLSRRVLIAFAASNLDVSVCDSETAEGMMRRLQEMGLSVIANDQWALLGNRLSGLGPGGAKHLLVVPRLTADTLSKDQQDRLLAALLEHSRFVPVENATDKEPDGSFTADILLRYKVYLLPGDDLHEQRMVVLLRQRNETGPNRLIFVEMNNGEFEVKWDSGELDAENVGIEFDDVDGNGKQEIVASGEQRIDYDSPEDDVLAVFDLEGHELTRLERCGSYPEEKVCPIQGEDVSFVTGTTPWEIEVSRDRALDYAKGTTYRLTKEKGRYVAIVSPGAKPERKKKKPQAPSSALDEAQPVSGATALNAQGLAQMKQHNYYEAATKFAEAAKNDSKNAEYANNAGYANYKMGHYEMAEIWLDTAIKLDPKRAVAYLNLGDTLVARQHDAEARDAYKKYLELAPDSKAVPDVKKKLDVLASTP